MVSLVLAHAGLDKTKRWLSDRRLGAFLADKASFAAILMQTLHFVCDQMLHIW